MVLSWVDWIALDGTKDQTHIYLCVIIYIYIHMHTYYVSRYPRSVSMSLVFQSVKSVKTYFAWIGLLTFRVQAHRWYNSLREMELHLTSSVTCAHNAHNLVRWAVRQLALATTVFSRRDLRDDSLFRAQVSRLSMYIYVYPCISWIRSPWCSWHGASTEQYRWVAVCGTSRVICIRSGVTHPCITVRVNSACFNANRVS